MHFKGKDEFSKLSDSQKEEILSPFNEATKELVANYEDFENDFKNFFKELIVASEIKRKALVKDHKL